MISLRKLLLETPQAAGSEWFHIGYGIYQTPDGRRFTYKQNKWEETAASKSGERWDDPRKSSDIKGNNQKNIRATRDHQQVAADASKSKQPKVADMWDNPDNTLYGPQSPNEEQVAKILAGNYSNIPLDGKMGDIETTTDGLNEIIGKLLSAENADRPEYAEDFDTGEETPIVDRIMQKIEESDSGYVKGTLLAPLFDWLSYNPATANIAKNRIVEMAEEVFPDKITLNQPIFRGLPVDDGLFDEFMKDYQVGQKVSFPDPYSFTGSSKVAQRFASIKGTSNNSVSTIFRILPRDSGEHSGYYLNGMVGTCGHMATWHSDVLGQDESENIEQVIDKLNRYLDEDEILIKPKTQYEVVGTVKIKAKPISDNQNPKHTIVIDLKELSGNKNENKLPGRPDLPPITSPNIGRVSRYLLNKPLNVKKG
jgi:hypothetical protein